MPAYHWVRATNTGPDAFTFELIQPPTGKTPRPPVKITLQRGERSMPFLYSTLVQDDAWRQRVRRKWVVLDPVEFTPAFVDIVNRSANIVKIPIRRNPAQSAKEKEKASKKRRSIVLEGRQSSGPVAVRALTRPLKELEELFDIAVDAWWDIGPPATPRALGTYGNEDVYWCDCCGGPIVFRYHPPVPIHI